MIWNPPRLDTDGRKRDAYPRIRLAGLNRRRNERRREVREWLILIGLSGAGFIIGWPLGELLSSAFGL